MANYHKEELFKHMIEGSQKKSSRDYLAWLPKFFCN